MGAVRCDQVEDRGDAVSEDIGSKETLYRRIIDIPLSLPHGVVTRVRSVNSVIALADTF